MFSVRGLILWAAQALIAGTAYATEPPRVSTEGPVWDAGAGFSFIGKVDKKRESLSGIACPPVLASPRLCVAAFDEGGEERYFLIGDGRLTPEPDRIVLLPDDKEIDAEGAARDGNMVYVTGSFAPKRKNCEPNRNSRHVFRFNVDPATGHATLDGRGTPVDLQDAGDDLWRLLTENHVLKKFVGDGKCLGKPDHAVNIEGLAAKDGMLYFGLREPAQDEHTFILPVSANELFGGGALSIEPLSFKVGSGRGIRDLLAVSDGILLLIGPDDDSKDMDWSVALWNGSGSPATSITPKVLANLDLHGVSPRPCKQGDKGDVKPEAFTIIEDGAEFRRLLILSDGMCDGGAMSFKIPK
jgi:hypothetical protein